MKKTIITLIGLLLLSSIAFAETIYTDGYIPPRLIDGMIVSSGVTDEEAQEYAAQYKAEKAAVEVRIENAHAPVLASFMPSGAADWMGPRYWGIRPLSPVGGELPGAAFIGRGQWGQWLTPSQPPLIPGAWMYGGPELSFSNPFYESWFNSFYPVGPGVQGFVPARRGPAIMPDNYPTLNGR